MKKLPFSFLFTLSLLTVIFVACDEDDDNGTEPVPAISGINPASGMVGDTITISGSNFGNSPSVTIGDQAATMIGTASATSIQAQIPQLNPGAYDVEVTAGGETATASTQFTVTEEGSNEPTVITITDDDLEAGQEYSWTADNEYMLTGLVFLEEGGVLNIEAGTTVRFAKEPGEDNTSALIVTRGAQIFAEGTADAPIIFTAEADTVGNILTAENNQEWGGLVLLGNAPAYSDGVTDAIQIEGIDTDETRARYGGNDPEDNSGVLKYVSIRYTGAGLSAGNEIQGLTLGAIGSGTTLEYIDIYASSDDGVEIFGGTVNIKYLSAAFATDDALDFDLGWRGTAQYVFAIQLSGAELYDHMGEWDGGAPDDAPLFSAPNIYNATLVGPGIDAVGADRAILMREKFAGKVVNSILEDFPGYAIQVQDLPGNIVDSYSLLTTPVEGYQVELLNNTFAQFGYYNQATGLASLVEATETEGFTGEVASTVAALTDNNNVYSAEPVLTGISRNPDGGLDPRPAAATDAAYTTVPEGVDQVDYRGAFEPGQSTWLTGWSTLSQLGYLAD